MREEKLTTMCHGILFGREFYTALLQIKEILRLDLVGGALHVVICDDNVDDESIIWCLDNSIPTVENKDERQLYDDCARLLLKLSEHERQECINMAYKGMNYD